VEQTKDPVKHQVADALRTWRVHVESVFGEKIHWNVGKPT